MKINYSLLIEQAHIKIIKNILEQVKQGQGAHLNEIYLTFKTQNVKMSNALKKIYPEIMSILIFGTWTDMELINKNNQDILMISMNFPTGAETLEIPLYSLTQYIDKTNSFALKFTLLSTHENSPSNNYSSTTGSDSNSLDSGLDSTFDSGKTKSNILKIDFNKK